MTRQRMLHQPHLEEKEDHGLVTDGEREREWNSTQHNIRNHLVLDRQGQTRDWWIISRVGLSLLVQEECAASEHEKSITTRRSVVVDWSFSAFSSIKRWCRINLNSGHYKIVIRAMDLMRQQWTSIPVFININTTTSPATLPINSN